MKLFNSRTIKSLLIANMVFCVATISELLVEMVGGDIGSYVRRTFGISTRTLVYCLIGSLIVSLLFATYNAFNGLEKKEFNVPGESFEEDLKVFSRHIYESYKARYESKLDGLFEITLEVNEEVDGNRPSRIKERYSKDPRISQAFPAILDALTKKDRLLIVGSPGVGKTVLLLKLALNLLDTRGRDEDPIPVIFNLASWSPKYKDFEDWLVEVLHADEGMSKEFAAILLEKKRILLLLDGLDELARLDGEIGFMKRSHCFSALNTYLRRGCKMVVSCRLAEFLEIQEKTGQDAPVAAKIEVLDLSKAEILLALQHAQNDTKSRTSATNILKIIDDNDIFLNALGTPFYFTTALDVYDTPILDLNDFPKDTDAIKRFLLERFVQNKVFYSRNRHYLANQNTHRCLSWLARLLEREQLVRFELAYLQPGDLRLRRLYFLMIAAIFVGAVSLSFGTAVGMYGGFEIGLVVGGATCTMYFILHIIWVLFSRIANKSRDGDALQFLHLFLQELALEIYPYKFARLFEEMIDTEDQITYSFSKILTWDYIKRALSQFFGATLVILIVGFLIVVLTVMVGSIVGSLWGRLAFGWNLGLNVGLLAAVLFAAFIMMFGVVPELMENLKVVTRMRTLTNPYQRIYGGFKLNLVLASGMILFLILCLCFVKFFELTQDSGTLYAILALGGLLPLIQIIKTPLFKHWVLRLALTIEGVMPLRYASFLNRAAEARILEKDGGGHWRFRHHHLQAFYANENFE